MKQPGKLLEHASETYLLVEGGYNDDTRSVTVLTRPGNDMFRPDDHTVPVVWRDQGEWFPVGRWSVGMLTFQDSRHEEYRELLEELVERYVEEYPLDPDVAWTAVDSRGEFAVSLENILPMGLAVPLFDSYEAAEDQADAARVVPVRNVAQFLTHLTREGYAGSLWNGLLPVFFCIDEVGELQFLRIRRGETGTVDMDILDPIEGWNDYEGSEEIEFLDNRDACDARLVQFLGMVPVLHWPGAGDLWSAGPAENQPGLVRRDEDGLTYGLLFTSEERAEAWLDDIDEEWVVWPVDDVRTWLTRDELERCGGGILNPGDHRARSGILWTEKDRIVLDTFSGFWTLQGDEFAKID